MTFVSFTANNFETGRATRDQLAARCPGSRVWEEERNAEQHIAAWIGSYHRLGPEFIDAHAVPPGFGMRVRLALGPEKEMGPLGSADVRMIAATNRPLKEAFTSRPASVWT